MIGAAVELVRQGPELGGGDKRSGQLSEAHGLHPCNQHWAYPPPSPQPAYGRHLPHQHTSNYPLLAFAPLHHHVVPPPSPGPPPLTLPPPLTWQAPSPVTIFSTKQYWSSLRSRRSLKGGWGVVGGEPGGIGNLGIAMGRP